MKNGLDNYGADYKIVHPCEDIQQALFHKPYFIQNWRAIEV